MHNVEFSPRISVPRIEYEYQSTVWIRKYYISEKQHVYAAAAADYDS